MIPTFERDITHCEPTTYAKEVTVKTVEPAKNSDNLVTLTFKEIGWQAVVAEAKGVAVGDTLFFIPVDSVLPLELSDKLGVTKYLSKGRVKAVKLRGNRSEGLVVEKEDVEPFLPYIMKWEDPPTLAMRGNQLASQETPFQFSQFYKMPNLLNEPETFREGEMVFISEKIHGTNCRFGLFPHPISEDMKLYVGSRTTVQQFDSESLYNRVVHKLVESIGGTGNLPQNLVFFGEIFGNKIQHLSYDRNEPEIKVFAILEADGNYMPADKVELICAQHNLPCVRFEKVRFTDIEAMRTRADKPSEYTTNHVREGIVIQSEEKPNNFAKVLGDNYLTSKKRTERH